MKKLMIPFMAVLMAMCMNCATTTSHYELGMDYYQQANLTRQ